MLLNQWQFFPRSLRQLVMIAFLLVMVPLLVLAWQAWQSLNTLSAQALETNRSTLVDARRSEAMSNTALEMERNYRQYCVLDDTTLAKVYQQQLKRYSLMLAAHQGIVPQENLYSKLRQSLHELAQLSCKDNAPDTVASAHLETFSRANTDLVQATRSVIFSRGQQLQQEIALRGKFFGWLALVLFLLSLGLVIVFTRMIIGPVNNIERMINLLGEGRLLDKTTVFKGPRELQTVGQRIAWLSERLGWLESQRHEFLRHLSHELKTPLASLREGTELLADRVAGPLTADQEEVVAILDSSSRHLQKLIEQLLDYNKNWADGSALPVKVELAPLIESVIAAHSLPARAKMMHTECRISPTACLADPQLLMSVLNNLYSNAVYYGNESSTIYLRSQRVASVLYIEIANSGQPIPEAEREMIFEAFYQGSHQRKGAVKGSGLGLSIAQACIRRMHGELRLVDSPLAEVCFRIALPVFSEKNEK